MRPRVRSRGRSRGPWRPAERRRDRGLTFIEMLLVVAILAMMAAGALPMVHQHMRRLKELELKRTLVELRGAIDRYHEYAVLGQIEPWDIAWNMYPKDLDMLIEGVDVKESAESEPVIVKFLRRVPVDPLTGEAEWDCRGYTDDPDDRSDSCEDWYDVYSRSQDVAIDGTYYRDW